MYIHHLRGYSLLLLLRAAHDFQRPLVQIETAHRLESRPHPPQEVCGFCTGINRGRQHNVTNRRLFLCRPSSRPHSYTSPLRNHYTFCAVVVLESRTAPNGTTLNTVSRPLRDVKRRLFLFFARARSQRATLAAFPFVYSFTWWYMTLGRCPSSIFCSRGTPPKFVAPTIPESATPCKISGLPEPST